MDREQYFDSSYNTTQDNEFFINNIDTFLDIANDYTNRHVFSRTYLEIINNDINLGSTINLDTLVQSNATLQGYYNRFYGLLPVGANVAAEAYVKSGNFSTTVAGLSPATISVGDLSFTGESLKAYFKLTQ